MPDSWRSQKTMPEVPIIAVEGVSKCYTLNHLSGQASYRKFSDALIQAAKAPMRWMKGGAQRDVGREREEFWALNEVSFEIQRGEVVGIIGRNGAGKSTLLKILSRITEPTKGRITLGGRVASLLEVGTGFHPELSGRENIYLNGAILGMTKAEIRAKFDEIVDFAEIEKFLDTPVKRYSSGMYVRLAFAVAAHLEPEILIVDEVLAVGDSQFQAKCLGKMENAASGGRTVLLVTHNMLITRRLCSKAMLLEAGRIRGFGETAGIVSDYEERGLSQSQPHLAHLFHVRRWWAGGPEAASESSHVYDEKQAPEFCFELHAPRAATRSNLGLHLRDASNTLLVSLHIEPFEAPEGRLLIRLKLASLPLLPGVYRWQVGLVVQGELVLQETLLPELHVTSESHGHPQPGWTPLMNLAYDCECKPL